MDRIKVFVCEPGKAAYTGNLINKKTAYQEFVGGEYKAELVDKNTVLIYNKDMTEKGDKPNRRVGNLIICGTFFLASASDNELYKELDVEQIQYYNAMLGKPEDIAAQDCEMNAIYGRLSIGKDYAYINNLNFYMNKNKTDFGKIAASYKTADKTAAKEFLKEMHSIFVDTFGTCHVDDLADEGEGMVHLPAVLQSVKTGDIQIGLVNVDTESSGEHWGTQHAVSKGFVSYESELDEQSQAELHSFGVYKYWYTPIYFGDIHINKLHMPDDVREIINYAVSIDEQKQEMSMDGM